MPTSPLTLESFSLAREVEAMQFAVEHGLGGDQATLDAARARLLREAPDHPWALNLRAIAALPETALPAPGPELRATARALRAGDPAQALREAIQAAARGPARATCALGDLLLLHGDPQAAEQRFREAMAALGPLPPLLTRLGRAAELNQRPGEAWQHTVEALATNPLWGTARWQLRRLGEASGRSLAPLPLKVLDEEESGPWRALRQRWRAEGLEEAWRWTERLTAHTAEEFRQWNRENKEALRRFFGEGLQRGA